MARRKHTEPTLGSRAVDAANEHAEPHIVLTGQEMLAWRDFKAASSNLLRITNALKGATLLKQQTAEALLSATHDNIVEAQQLARQAVDEEAKAAETFKLCQARWRDTLTALAAAVAPG